MGCQAMETISFSFLSLLAVSIVGLLSFIGMSCKKMLSLLADFSQELKVIRDLTEHCGAKLSYLEMRKDREECAPEDFLRHPQLRVEVLCLALRWTHFG